MRSHPYICTQYINLKSLKMKNTLERCYKLKLNKTKMSIGRFSFWGLFVYLGYRLSLVELKTFVCVHVLGFLVHFEGSHCDTVTFCPAQVTPALISSN